MGEDYKVGDWGMAHFEFHKRGHRVGITAFGQITGIEKKVLTFHDDFIDTPMGTNVEVFVDEYLAARTEQEKEVKHQLK